MIERDEGEQFGEAQSGNPFERLERRLEEARGKGIEIPSDFEIDNILVVRSGEYYLSREDTEKLTGLTRSTVLTLANTNRLDVVKPNPKALFFSLESTLDYLENRRNRPGPRPKKPS